MAQPRRVWLFDLDNTLHDASSAAFPGINQGMSDFMVQQLGLARHEADTLRHRYWLRYGATLLGLVRHHGVAPVAFLQHAHRLPGLEARLRHHPHDVAALKRLRGRRIILTNAPRQYAQRVLQALGLMHLFDGLIAVEDMAMFGQLRPKPDARMLRRVAARLRVHPAQCTLVEDTLAHQKAAHALGMGTVWMQRWLRGGLAGHGGALTPQQGQRLARRPAYVGQRVRGLLALRRGR